MLPACSSVCSAMKAMRSSNTAVMMKPRSKACLAVSPAKGVSHVGLRFSTQACPPAYSAKQAETAMPLSKPTAMLRPMTRACSRSVREPTCTSVAVDAR